MSAEAGPLRALFDHCVPHRVRPALKRGFWWGARHVCPVCGAHVRRYLSEGFDLPVLPDRDAPARMPSHAMARVGPNPLRAALGRSRARVRRWLEPVRYLPFALGHARSPRSITIDPLARCNLRCPLCPTGRGHNTSAGKGILTLSLYCKILDQLPKLRTLLLFNWGEPLLHPQIEEIIAIAHRRGIGVHAHSNLSIKKDDAFFERLIDAGLTSLWVSIDGASEETYSRYRVGGDFGLAIANVDRLARIKRR